MNIKRSTPLYDCLGTDRLSVNSYHHQAVKDVAPGLEIMAESDYGIVEALYMPSYGFLWAVQWHPEFNYLKEESSRKIFEEFVRQCSE